MTLLGRIFGTAGVDELIAAGNRAEKDGRLAEACKLYRQAVSTDPRHAGARLNLGIGLEAVGELAAARTSFEEALALEPANAAAHYNLGRLFLMEGAHERAVHYLSAALDARAEFPEAHIVRGHARHALGDLDAAALDLAAGLKRLPDDEEARRALAAVRASLGVRDALQHHAAGRRSEAEAGYRSVLREQPEHAAGARMRDASARLYEDAAAVASLEAFLERVA